MTKATEKKAPNTQAKVEAKVEKKVEQKVEEAVSATDRYFDGVQSVSEKMLERAAVARARNGRIMDSFAASVRAGQKDMLELSRDLAASPLDYRGNMQRILDTMQSRQACALSFGQTVMREQSEYGSELREGAKKMAARVKDSNLSWATPYRPFSAFWAAGSK